MQTTRQTATLTTLRHVPMGVPAGVPAGVRVGAPLPRGFGEWLATLAVLLLRALAVVVLLSPLALAVAWLLG